LGFQDARFQDGFQAVGFQRSYYPASDFGVKKIETPTLDGEDGLLRNRSISEALEVVPTLTGRYRKNVGDYRPEVYGGSADGNLPRKPIMEVSLCRYLYNARVCFCSISICKEVRLKYFYVSIRIDSALPYLAISVYM